MKPIEICSDYVKDDEGKGCSWHIEDGFCRKPDKFRCPVWMYMFLGEISVSQANTFMKCKRMYKYKYLNGIEVLPKMQPKPMKMGSLLHQGIEQIYSKKEVKPDYLTYFDAGDREIGIIQVILDKLKTLPFDDFGYFEHKFEINISDCPKIRGVFDVLHPTYFEEYKLTSRPEFYTSPHFLQSQLATYFLYLPELTYCTMKVIRTPQLRSTGQYKDEDTDGYMERVRKDIDKRPGYYFLGYDNESRTWGKKFYRSEFDMGEVVARFQHIMVERRLSIKRNCWYKNESQCLLPTPCMYLSICESNGISELIYTRKEVTNAGTKHNQQQG